MRACVRICTDLQSTMAPLLTLTQLFSLSVPTVSTSILLNLSVGGTSTGRRKETQGNRRKCLSYQYLNLYLARESYGPPFVLNFTDFNAILVEGWVLGQLSLVQLAPSCGHNFELSHNHI